MSLTMSPSWIVGNRFVPAPSIIQAMYLNQAVGWEGEVLIGWRLHVWLPLLIQLMPNMLYVKIVQHPFPEPKHPDL